MITFREEVFRSFKASLFGFNMRQSKTAVRERLFINDQYKASLMAVTFAFGGIKVYSFNQKSPESMIPIVSKFDSIGRCFAVSPR